MGACRSAGVRGSRLGACAHPRAATIMKDAIEKSAWLAFIVSLVRCASGVVESPSVDRVPGQGRRRVQMADCDGEGIGSVLGFGRFRQLQQPRDHLLDLELVCLAITDDRRL